MKRFRLGRFWLEFRKNPRTGVDVRYKERPPEYAHSGDCHPFWELLYVDRGLVRIRLGEPEHALSQGDFVLIAPRQSHSVLPTNTGALFYVTAHFETNLEGLAELGNEVLRADEEGRRLLIALLREKQSGLPASEPLALSYLAQFLIQALRGVTSTRAAVSLPTFFQANAERATVDKAVDFMRRRFHDRLTLEEIAGAAGVSNSRLAHLFKRKMGVPVMGYLQNLRIQYAKTLLLESAYNVSEIAQLSGYSSVHLFSRRFKKLVFIPPSQYAKMVRLAAAGVSSNSQKQSRAG